MPLIIMERVSTLASASMHKNEFSYCICGQRWSHDPAPISAPSSEWQPGWGRVTAPPSPVIHVDTHTAATDTTSPVVKPHPQPAVPKAQHSAVFDTAPPVKKPHPQPAVPTTKAQHAASGARPKAKSATKRKAKTKHKTPRCRYADPTAEDLPPIESFDPNIPFSAFGGDFRRFAWREMRANIENDTWPEENLRTREQALAECDTPLGRKLKILLELRGHQKFMRGQYKLNFVMEELEDAQDEEADADVWILLSRGFQIHPEGFDHPVQHGENYASCEDFKEEFETEMDRNIEMKFAARFSAATKAAGIPTVQPVVIMSLGVVVKDIDVYDETAAATDTRQSLLEAVRQVVQKSRIICDASSNGKKGGDRYTNSLNDLVVKHSCQLAGIEYTLSAASRHGLIFVVDESDCYLWVKMAAHSLKHVCFMYKGKLHTWTSMCFGLRNAPHAAQALSNFLIRCVRKRIVRMKLACSPVAGGNGDIPKNRPTNDSDQMLAKVRSEEAEALLKAARKKQKLAPKSFAALKREAARRSAHVKKVTRSNDHVDALHAFLDDIAGLARTPRAAWAAFLCLLWMAHRLGIPLNMKSHKSRSPAHTQGLLGCVVDLSQFEVRLTTERVATLIRECERIITEGNVGVVELMHLVGVLVWASAVIPARPYYRQLLDLLQAEGYCLDGRYTKPARSKTIAVPAEQIRCCKAWSTCLRAISGSGISRGIRKHRCPYALSSDACCRKLGSGWGWQFAGIFDHGLFPKSWAKFIDEQTPELREIFVGYLEGAALLYGLRFAAGRHCTTRRCVKVITDNKGLLFQLKKLSSRDPLMSQLLKEVFWLLQTYEIELEMWYCPSHLNSFTDKLSRRTLHSFTDQDSKDLDTHAKEAHAVADVATVRGMLRPALPVHAQFLEFLKAERVQVLEPEAAWGPQHHAMIDTLFEEWRIVKDTTA